NALRLNGQAVLDVVTLEDRAIQLRLEEGALNLALRDVPPDAQIEVATPWALVTIRLPGSYRVDADFAAESSRVVVRSGEALVNSGPHGILLNAGRAVEASATGLAVNDGATAYGLDDFDRWGFAREAEGGGGYSSYVPPLVTGYEMLDRSGSWSTYSGYGSMWSPGASYGWWAPYTYGHWAWVPPWGWSWVDDAPWAFATFRYGHWSFLDGRWRWAPGAIWARPVFAGFVPLRPGQVAFTSAFFVHGKPARHFLPLHPRNYAVAKRSLYGWPRTTLPSTARTMPGTAAAPRPFGSPAVWGTGAGGLPPGFGSPRFAPRSPATAVTLPASEASSRRGSAGQMAPAVPAPVSPASAAPAMQRGSAGEGSAAAVTPPGSDPSAGPGAGPGRGDAAASPRRGFQGRDSGTGGSRGPAMPRGMVRNHFHEPSSPAAVWRGFMPRGEAPNPFRHDGARSHTPRQGERRSGGRGP
ncbi:MAG TPA: DUF6600 domain-containing protein, partial [Burkholderiales bacterium]